MTAPFPAAALAPEVTSPVILALPKGRILRECGTLLARAGVHPAADYLDEDSRRLRFPTDDPALDVVRVRPFDVATFVAFGGGADRHLRRGRADGVRLPGDLRAAGPRHRPLPGQRRRAGRLDRHGGYATWSRVRIATKYPNIARRHFAARGIHADVVHLNGAMELAPGLGLSPPDRGPGADRVDPGRQRPARERGDRPRVQPPDRQPHRAEDAARGDRRLDRAVPRGAGA